jgi:hypothetical protein
MMPIAVGIDSASVGLTGDQYPPGVELKRSRA